MEKVYFIRTKDKEDVGLLKNKVKRLFDQSRAANFFKKLDFIGIKTHFGEEKNKTHINPILVKAIIDKIKSQGAVPFLTETSTLYRGERSNAIDHIALANRHGFGFEKMNVPIIMADGLFGDQEVSVGINGKNRKEVKIAAEIAKIQGLMVVSHFKGHVQTGFGGAFKNIGMGLASRKGKLNQHSVMAPEINRFRCTGCGSCIKWCPEDAISLVDGKALIDKKKCIGCGECLAVCKFNAVMFDWGIESKSLQESIVEYAQGVINAVDGNIFYFNFLTNITRDCDCLNEKGTIVAKDVGILAGRNIVAIEKASCDLFKEVNGKEIREFTFPNIDPMIQIEYAESLGMGITDYELIELN